MKLKYVLLGLIKLHPSVSGYELKSIITESTMYFFSASFSQIYPALKEMVNEGWVVFEVEPLVGKQDRKVYTITSKGNKELAAWLRSPLDLTSSVNGFRDFMLKLTFMGSLDKKSILAYLKAGLTFYKEQKRDIEENHLAIEKNYLTMESMDKNQYLFLWQQELDLIMKELNQRIQWIEDLILAVQQH